MNYELTDEELMSFLPYFKKMTKREQKKERFKEKIFSKIGKYKKRTMYCSSEPEQVGSMNYLRYILVSDNTPDKMVDRLCGDGGKVPSVTQSQNLGPGQSHGRECATQDEAMAPACQRIPYRTHNNVSQHCKQHCQ